LSAGASPQTPLGELTALPRPPSWIKGPTSKGRGRKGRGGVLLLRGGEGREGMRGKRRGKGEGEREGRKGMAGPISNPLLRVCVMKLFKFTDN